MEGVFKESGLQDPFTMGYEIPIILSGRRELSKIMAMVGL